MQKARDNIHDFDDFCGTFLSNVIGRQAYNKKIAHFTISKIATVSDEAFVILCLENLMDRWLHEAEKPEEVRKTPV